MKIQLPQIYPVASHTDYIGQGSTFVAIPGSKDNGNFYIQLALEKGAKKIVVQSDVLLSQEIIDCIHLFQAELIVVKNCRKALSELIAQALDYPSKKLKIVGVTGTKGKTSTSYMMYHLLSDQGCRAALISTAEKLIDKVPVAMDLTTPLPEHLHMFFDMCVKKGITHVVMEVSAQSLSLHRVDGIDLHAGIFSNFSLEHLEFYPTMQAYFDAKKKFFDMIIDKKNIFVNYDDPYGYQILQEHPEYSSYSLEHDCATWHAVAQLKSSYVDLLLKEKSAVYSFRSNLVGKFNAYNLCAAILVVHSLGFSLQNLQKSPQALEQIPGRMEQYPLKNGATCFIDYAHNPSSYEAVLSTLRQMTNNLIVVFGAGGARDKSKRPMMGAIVEKYANIAIVTSDNPRNESAAAIADDIVAGFSGLPNFMSIRELNRTKAIELAYEISQEGTIIAVLGKGRDEYQIVGHMTFPFKERAIIRPFLREDTLYKNL